MRRQVRSPHVAALGLQEGADAVGYEAVVEPVPAVGGDPLQGGGQRGVPEQAAHRRRLSAGQVERPRMVVQRAGRARDVAGEPCGDREAVAGIADGGLQQLRHRPGPEAVQGVDPGGHRAGHRDREGTVAGDPVEFAFGEKAGRGQRAGAPASVHRVHATALGFVVDHEGVTPDTVHVRAHHGQHPGHGDGRVEGVAAPAQNVVTRRGRKRMAGRYRPGDAAYVGTVGGGKDYFPGALSGRAGLGRRLRRFTRGRGKDETTACEGDGRGRARGVKSGSCGSFAHGWGSWVPVRRWLADWRKTPVQAPPCRMPPRAGLAPAPAAAGCDVAPFPHAAAPLPTRRRPCPALRRRCGSSRS